MPKGYFDVERFYRALDKVRQDRGITWRKVADAAEISASTLTRMAQRRRPDVDSLTALLNWSGLKHEDFSQVSEHDTQEDQNTVGIITGYLRADRNLSPESADALEQLFKAAYETLRKDGQGGS